MSDPTLAARLALLAEETPVHENGLRVLPGTDRFAAIIHLIDQTVIPAMLHISDGTAELTLEVAGRRLCRLPGQIETLAPDDEAALASAVTAITTFADAGDAPLKVAETLSNEADVDATQSVSIHAIASAAGRPLIDPDAPALVQLQAGLGKSLSASIIVEGGSVTQKSGDDALCETLTDGIGGMSDLMQSSGPELIVFEAADGTTLRGTIVDGDMMLSFAADATAMVDIAAGFNRSFPG